MLLDETDPLLPRAEKLAVVPNPRTPLSPRISPHQSFDSLFPTSVWDATYRETLTGEICVSEIVVFILLFLECHLPSLNSAAQVS